MFQKIRISLFVFMFAHCTLKDSTDCYIGAAVDSWKLDKNKTILTANFNSITPEYEFGMSDVMSAAGVYDYAGADKVAKFARENKLRVVGHSFAWHGQMPAWLASETDPAIFKSHVANYMQAMVTRYGDIVTIWNVANEAIADDASGLRTSIFANLLGPNWLIWIFSEANKIVNPSTLLLYNDYDLLISSGKLEKAISEIKRIRIGGGRVDGLGEQMHITLTYPDIKDIRLSFERIKNENLYLHISEMDVSANEICGYTERSATLENQIAQRYADIVKAYLEIIPKNRRLGITVWGVRNDESWLNKYHGCTEWGLLFNADGTPDLSYFSLRDTLFTIK